MPKQLMNFCPQCGKALETVNRDGLDRIQCSDQTNCDYVFWNNPTPVVAAIVEYNGQIVLARNAAWPPEWFALITGFLEAKEDPNIAVLREVKEELDLDAEVVELVGVYEFARMNQVIIAYHVKATGTIQLSEELIDYRLMNPADIHPWPGGTGQAMKKWLADRGIFNEDVIFAR